MPVERRVIQTIRAEAMSDRPEFRAYSLGRHNLGDGAVTNWIAIAAELKHDEDRETTPAMNKTLENIWISTVF